MSNYEQQEFDFVKRTREILHQYEKLQPEGEEKYEVTLLLNCFVGLLILPKEYWYEKLPTTEVDENEWGINPKLINHIEGNSKSVQQIARRFRNSITHYRFEVFSNKKGEIGSIEFNDCKGNNSTFKAEIPVENLKLFLKKLSDWFLKEMEKAK